MNIQGKIVIVDDEQMITNSLSMLFMVEGIDNVFCFNDTDEALDFLKENEPDIVLSDFIMPKLNGIEFLQEVKKLYPDVSTILLTGYADKENAIKAINDVGIYKYIEKPWDNEDLLINIRNGIERSHLLTGLKEKIVELEKAKTELQKYSTSLETIVDMRTKELQTSNNKMQALINCCADGILTINKEGKILSANPACENLFSMSEEILKNASFYQLITSDDNEDLTKVLYAENEHIIRDVSFVNPLTQTIIPLEISIAQIENSDDKDIFVTVIRDISAQKEMQKMRDDFIATLTHDLRTPLLAAIQTLGFFLTGSLGELDEKQRKFLDTMKKSNEDMLGLVNALLEVYKYEAGKIELCKTNFEINELLNNCVQQLESLAINQNIQLKKEFNTNDNLSINADKNELRRVVINLLGNALTYTNANGTVTIKTKLENNDLFVSVEDTGIGIQKTDLGKMFNRFSQGTSQKRATGTGLGLYLSREIVEAHNGRIWVESTYGVGSEFTFCLKDCLAQNETMNV
ncbi:response regulator [bacterium]|nr:response regulator [bacterium]